MKTATVLAFITSALAAPSAIKRTTTRIDPILSQYTVWYGAVTYDTGVGLIQKTNGHEPDITTLVKFVFPADTEGQMCEIFFPLDDASTATGSQRAQVFSSLKPAEQTTTTWPSGNLRDQHLGDIRFEVPGGAIFENAYTEYSRGKFPCPAGYALGGEFVGRWDEVEIAWTQSDTAGPYIAVTSS